MSLVLDPLVPGTRVLVRATVQAVNHAGGASKPFVSLVLDGSNWSVTADVAAVVPPEGDWLPIDQADRSFVERHVFPGITILNSARTWVRDLDGGEPYEAVWSEGVTRHGAVWWAIAAEQICEPAEFVPHPLERQRFGR